METYSKAASALFSPAIFSPATFGARIRDWPLVDYTLGPVELDFSALEALGDVKIYDRTATDELVARAAGAEILLTNKTEISAEAIGQLDELRYIGVLATGYNVVDVAAASRRGIVVTNVPTYGTASVAQMVFAHVLGFAHHVAEHSAGVRAGRWSASPDWCYWDYEQVELAGQTMGVVGLGQIGRAVADLARAFGMDVVAHTPRPHRVPDFVRLMELDAVFKLGDVVSLHCPLNAQTQKLVNSERLALMKPSALLINTSRGGLVDERALAAALNEGRIAGAGLDVLSVEPPGSVNLLLTAKNCQITPHIAWATRAARARLLRTAIDNVSAFLAGTPQNVVGG